MGFCDLDIAGEIIRLHTATNRKDSDHTVFV